MADRKRLWDSSTLQTEGVHFRKLEKIFLGLVVVVEVRCFPEKIWPVQSSYTYRCILCKLSFLNKLYFFFTCGKFLVRIIVGNVFFCVFTWRWRHVQWPYSDHECIHLSAPRDHFSDLIILFSCVNQIWLHDDGREHTGDMCIFRSGPKLIKRTTTTVAVRTSWS